MVGNEVTLSWSAGTDAETSTNLLSYHVVVTDSAGVTQTVPAQANLSDGYRRVPGLGNAGQNLSLAFTVTTPGTYQWSLQTIDTHWSGSPFAAPQVFTMSYTVENTNDSGAGSLRQLVTKAPAGETITFAPSLSGQTIALASVLTVSSNLTISGTVPVTISGNNTTQLFDLTASAAVTLNSLTMVDGNSSGNGGAINVASGGQLTVNDSTLQGHTAASSGGAIYSLGTVTLNRVSGLSNTITAASGGFIRNKDGVAVINDSTIAYNQANTLNGGAIMNNSVVTITNSTVVHNYAENNGGGIFNSGSGSIYIDNSTFAKNRVSTSSTGGVDLRGGGAYQVRNSIFAAHINGSYNCQVGTFTGNNNLIESHLGCGTPTLTSDPMLGPLQDNGGSMWTMALLSGSPAIGTGDNATCLSTDQRGISRPQPGVGNCDIGAYEFDGVGAASVPSEPVRVYLPLVVK